MVSTAIELSGSTLHAVICLTDQFDQIIRTCTLRIEEMPRRFKLHVPICSHLLAELKYMGMTRMLFGEIAVF